MKVRWGRIAVFYVVTVLATHGLIALVAAVRGPPMKGVVVAGFLRANLAMLVPGVLALGFARFALREPIAEAVGLRWRPAGTWLVAWLLPAALTAASVGIRLLAPGAALSQGAWANLPIPQPWAALMVGLLAGATACLPGALAEEVAWRGLLRRELRSLGFWRSSLVIGLLWAGWHLPAVVLGGLAGGTARGAFELSLRLVLATPIAMALCERNKSVFPAVIMHASGSGMMAVLMVIKGGSGVFLTLAPIIPLLLTLAALVVFPDAHRESGRSSA